MAVKSYNLRLLLAPDLYGGLPKQVGHLGDFFTGADGRMGCTSLVSSFSSKENVSASFNLETMLCGACSGENEHLVLVRRSWQQQQENGGRIVFFLTDQAFPPVLPVREKKNCVAILRLEFGSLNQLMELFLKTTERWMVPAGSFIIVSSATQLASGSLQSYIHDLSDISDRIWTKFGGELEIVPGPPLLLSGTDSSQLIRGLHDLTAWIGTLKAGALYNSFGLVDSIVKERGVGRQTREMDIFMKLPASLSNNVKQVTVKAAGSGDLPATMSPLLEADEVRVLHQLSRDIEEKLKISLNLEGAGNRGLKEARSEPGTKMKILVVGASNAERLALELEQKSSSITRVITTNWRPALSGAVPNLVKQIEEAMAVSEPEVVIFEMLENQL